MTAGRDQDQRAAQAMAQGENERAARDTHAEAMQARIAGSETDTADAGRAPDDGAVSWFGTSRQPEAVSPQPTRSPNVTRPTDNSQNYG